MKSLLSLLKDWVNKQPEEEVVEESVESIVEDTPKDTDDYLVEYILSQFLHITMERLGALVLR